jgi:DNA-binding NarL/FixJ family response regulator
MGADAFAGYFADLNRPAWRGPHRDTDLSPCQLETLRYLSHGYTLPMIADAQGLSRETVSSRTQRIKQRLAAKTLTHAVAIALRAHLID